MKKVTLALTMLLSVISAQTLGAVPLSFASHKDRAGSLERSFLQNLAAMLGTTLFVETGTYNGDTAAQAAFTFKQVHTIKRRPDFYKNAVRHFAHQPHVAVYQGSSSEAFAKFLPTIKSQGKILFYLNDHCSDKTTGAAQQNPAAVETSTEIRKELLTIKQCGVQNCAILIDNIHRFGTRTDGQEFAGHWAHPMLQEVCKNLLEINRNFELALIGDMLLAVDKSANIAYSPAVKACTVSRLFDGSNPTEDELLQAEKTIAACQGAERAYLKELCRTTGAANYPEFHPQLWLGLLSLEEKRFVDALQAFDTVLTHRYTHWRIKHYRMLTKKACTLRIITRQEFLKTLK